MKTIFTALLLSLAFSLNAQDLPKHKKPKETKDPVVFDITKNQGTVIGYDTPEEVKEKFESEAKLKMYSEQQKDEQYALLPVGGYLRLVVNRLSIEAANTKWFTVIVQTAQGEELLRQTLESRVASPIHGPVTYWLNLALVPLSQPLPNGSMVFVIDELTKKRHEYLIKLQQKSPQE